MDRKPHLQCSTNPKQSGGNQRHIVNWLDQDLNRPIAVWQTCTTTARVFSIFSQYEECVATFLASLAQTSLSPTNNLCRKMPRERQQEGKQKRPFVKLQETEKLDFFSRRGSHLCIHPLKVPLNKNGGEQMSLSSLLRRRYCRSKKVCRLFTGLQTRQGGCFQRCPMLLHGTNVITTNG